MGLDQCRLMDLPKISDPRGNLTFLESFKHLPFQIQRVFFIYDVPTGADRGAHAHRELQQALICLSGSFNVNLDDGKAQKTFHLNRPWQALYVPPMVWGWESDFDPGSVCLVLASAPFNESDYIRDHGDFLLASRKTP
jgi:hypothetical protein